MRASAQDRRRVWAAGSGLAVFVPVSILLFREFTVPGNTAWNVALVLMLLGFGAAALLIHHYLLAHPGEVGEARFDTSNRDGAARDA